MAQRPPASPNLLPRASGVPHVHHTPWWGKLLVGVFSVSIVGGIVFTAHIMSTVSKAFSVGTNATSLLQQIQQLLNPPEKTLQGEDADRVNILLLGMGGEGHDGALLTDTMIVASIKPSTEQVGMFSIPRDLVAEVAPNEYRKINSANAFGEKKDQPGSGALAAKAVVEKVIGSPIQYFVRVDFGGFAQLVDNIGGIDVTVENTFTDYEYPNNSYGYQTIAFKAGPQHMNGDIALKYVRSRHGNNNEGSDFARSRRQQIVLTAVKAKIFSAQTLLNPGALTKVLTTLGAHVQTNFQPWELLRLATLGKNVDNSKIENRVLDTSPTGLLVNSTGLDGAYILVPKLGLGKYKDIQAAFAALTGTPTVTSEQATVDIENGTTVGGLGTQTSASLRAAGITVGGIRNAKSRTQTTTVIYDLTNGAKPVTKAALESTLHASTVAITRTNSNSALTNATDVERYTADATYSNADFVVLLGADQESTVTSNSNTHTNSNSAQ